MRLAFFASLFLATPLSAQDTAAPQPVPTLTVTTPAQDLDCIIWATYMQSKADDPKDIATTVAAIGYFSGLYEGKTGKAVNAAFKARLDAVTPAQISTFGNECSMRFVEFSKRLGTYGL